MNKKIVALLLGAGAVVLGVVPLLFTKGDFEGADAKAQDLIQEVAPDFQPWAKPLFEPPSSEVESLLFAVQAALGAGVIGFIAGWYYARSLSQRSTPSKSQQS